MTIDPIQNGDSGLSARQKINEALDRVSLPQDFGQLTMVGNTTATVITTAGVPVKAAGNAAAGPLNSGFDVDNGGLVRVGGNGQALYALDAVCTVTGSNNDRIILRFARNGVVCPACASEVTMPAAARPLTVSITGGFLLGAGDRVDVWVENATDTDDVTLRNLTMRAVRVFGWNDQ